MAPTTDAINEAALLEADAAHRVEAAVSEGTRASAPFSIDLLIRAAQKERDSLDAIEESMETLRLALSRRRKAIDQQEEALRDLSESLMRERS